MFSSSQSGKRPSRAAETLSMLATEGSGENDFVDLFYPEVLHHDLCTRVHGSLGKLNGPDVILGDDDVLTDRRLAGPGNDELRHAVLSAGNGGCSIPC